MQQRLILELKNCDFGLEVNIQFMVIKIQYGGCTDGC